MTVEELVHERVLRRSARSFAVMAGGDFAGLITLTDVRRVRREDWPATSVFRAMTPATRLHTVRGSDTLASVLQLMAERDVNQLPVVEGRALAGMLDRGDVMRFIQVRRDLGETGSGTGPLRPATQL
jgi:CBS domain-containing protein